MARAAPVAAAVVTVVAVPFAVVGLYRVVSDALPWPLWVPLPYVVLGSAFVAAAFRRPLRAVGVAGLAALVLFAAFSVWVVYEMGRGLARIG